MKGMILWWLAACLPGAVLAGGITGQRFDCLLEPNEEVALGGESPGLIAAVTVDRGARVKKGQVLVRLADGLERAALKRAQQRIAHGRRRLRRNRELIELKMVSQEERDAIEMDIRDAEADAAEARERLRLRVLRSPIDGVVIERNVGPGERLGQDPALRLASLDPLHVEVILSAEYFGQVRPGQIGRVHPAAPVGGDYPAKVTVVDPVIDPGSGTFRVRLSLPNPGNRLPAGLRCQVAFESPERGGVSERQ